MAIIKKFRIKSFKQKKPILKLDKVSLSFGKRQILENIDFEINKGEISSLKLICLPSFLPVLNSNPSFIIFS